MKIPGGNLKKPRAQSASTPLSGADRLAAIMDTPVSGELEMSLNDDTQREAKVEPSAKPSKSAHHIESQTNSRVLPSGLEVESRHTKVDPKRVRVWSANTRYGVYDNDQDLEQSIEKLGGNHTPVLIRPIEDADYDYELIYGTQRIQACLNKGKLLYAEIADVPDADAFVLMLSENVRKDPSDWRLIKSWQKGLDDDYFANQEMLANHLGMRREYLNSLLAVLDLPDFYFAQLEKDIPKASRANIKTFGALWRKGIEQSGQDAQESGIHLAEKLHNHLRNKTRLDVQSAVRLLEDTFGVKKFTDEVSTYSVNGHTVKVSRSKAGSLTVTVPAKSGADFMDGLLGYIQSRSLQQ